MVDPMNITIYDRNDRQLQEFLIFCICVAGKTAQTTALAVERFLNILSYEDPDPICKGCTLRPLTLIGLFSESEIAEAMRQAGLGCYYQRSVALKRLATMWRAGALDLRTCSIEDLEGLPWVGPKTARLFVMHSRPGVRAAAIDRHILKHLAEQGLEVPTQTPSNPRTYARLEEEFLNLADAAGKSPADYDLEVWKCYAQTY